MRRALLIIAAGGALLFGSVLALSWLNPLLIERAARDVVRIEVEQRVGEKIDTLSNSKVAILAAKALGQTEAEIEGEIEGRWRALQDGVPSKVAQALADLLRVDCECRRRMRERARHDAEQHLGTLEQVRARLQGLIETAYASTTDQLLRELRIVCASNAAVFGLLGLLAWHRARATLQLLLPAAVLLGAAGVTGGLYLFEQNWMHTLVFGDYVGWGYLGYLGLAFALLSDVAFNHARVITSALNAAFNVVGSAVVVVPC
ncbi:hypothetical protein AACH06_10000 [Ideonella sp. DXS29W]|uniref:Uncharacterized protein n=1 Tax=Ideonella lacteola TaxID=2984193 RepID=A0ABU9BMS3_9BURK